MSTPAPRKSSKSKHANMSEQGSDEDATLTSKGPQRSRQQDTDPAHKPTVREDNPHITSPSTTLPHDPETPALRTDPQSGLPLAEQPPPLSSPTLRKWRNALENLSSNLARSVRSAIQSALGKEDTSAEGRDSDHSSADSRFGWDRVETAEVKNGRYEAFVKEQDAREYDHVSEQETESGDEGEDEEDEKGLGGERWDKTLL